MANKTGIGALVDTIKRYIEAYRQALKTVSQDKERSQKQAEHMSLSAEPDSELVLEIGNELLITDELVKSYQRLRNSLGRVVIIDQISSKEGSNIQASAFGIQVGVSMQVARHMRAAFLKREQSNLASDNPV